MSQSQGSSLQIRHFWDYDEAMGDRKPDLSPRRILDLGVEKDKECRGIIWRKDIE